MLAISSVTKPMTPELWKLKFIDLFKQSSFSCKQKVIDNFASSSSQETRLLTNKFKMARSLVDITLPVVAKIIKNDSSKIICLRAELQIKIKRHLDNEEKQLSEITYPDFSPC